MTSGISISPSVATTAPIGPLESASDDDRQVDDVRPGEKLGQRQRFGELALGQPAAPFDEHPVGERHDAAEAGHADYQEAPEQRAGRDTQRGRRPVGHAEV